MSSRILAFLFPLFLAAPALAQSPATAPSDIQRAAADLTSDDFHTRQLAVKKIQSLLANEIANRAQIQAALNDVQAELSRQIQSLAIVSDPEAQVQTVGLLEMERGLAAWTIDAMTEPADTRQPLLNWGLSADVAPLLARVYSHDLKTRVKAVAELAKIKDDGADWTLARLVNDAEPALRTAAIAGLYDRKPTPKSIAALWYRSIVGPGIDADSVESANAAPAPAADNADTIDIPFPNHDPFQFSPDNDDDFTDSVIATDVLVHWNSPPIADRIRALVLKRTKSNDGLSSDNAWTLNVHHLIEAYKIKEAAPLLALEALGNNSQMNADEVNGHAFIWTDRTIAIGALMKIAGADPESLGLTPMTNTSSGNDWLWAAANKKEEIRIVAKFRDWWKDHYSQFGLKATDPAVTAEPAADQADDNNGPPPRRIHLPMVAPTTAPVENP